MAVLSKIRQRSLLVILFVGFGLFAFIIGDLVHSNLFSQSSRNVGSVNGTDLIIDDFRLKVANVEKGGQNTTTTQAVARVWEQEVAIALLNTEFDKAGINVGESQIMEVLKQSQDIGQNPQFLNKAGVFDVAKFKEFFKSNPTLAANLKDREKDASLNAKYGIYSTLIKAGIYTTTVEAKLKYEMEANKVNFDYVSVLFSSIKDSDVKVTDDEVVAFIKKDEKKYKSDANREVEYVSIEEKASAEDENEVKNAINASLTGSVVYNQATGKNDTLQGFKSAKNVAEYVNANSDKPFDSTYVAKKDLPAAHAEKLFSLAVGELYGPYTYDGYYAISRGMGRQAGAQAKASHILLAYKGATRAAATVTRTKEEAAAKAQEVMAIVTASPQSFMMQAFTLSDDSSKQQGGDLGYFSKGQMTPKFNDFVFANPIGKIGLVETEFGYHIINVTDKQDAVKLATIARKIEASEATTDKIFAKAVQFEMDAANQDFEKLAKKNTLTVNPKVKIKAMDETVGAITNQRQIVQWAFDSKTNIGDVKRFEVVNIGHVIVKLKTQSDEGLMTAEEARPLVETILKNKKKAAKIKAKMTGSTLEAIAKASGSTVQTASDLTAENAVLQGVGMEAKVVATAFAIGNKISLPIEGNSGVFVLKTKTVVKAPTLTVYSDYIAKLNQQNASAAGRVIGALKTDAKIEDNRALFY